ncbi:MAG: hypothetical protein LUH21_04765 [Clostridiales bacterium]|nr:hypothetical protein [Clostridiales bacterium]
MYDDDYEEQMEYIKNWKKAKEEKKKRRLQRIDDFLSRVQLYSYKLPTVKIGNAIMDFREKHILFWRGKDV